MPSQSSFESVAELPVGPQARVYESGWQSWSVSTAYGIDERPRRPAPASALMNGWGNRLAPLGTGFQGEGLLAVGPTDGGEVVIVAAPAPDREVPTIRAAVTGSAIAITADGPVEVIRYPATTSIALALANWAEILATRLVTEPIRVAPTIWCSWYHYFTDVTAADIEENIRVIDQADLPLDVIQIDDGYQAEIGDWLTLSDRFSDLRALVEGIAATGRRAGIWVAPFLAGERSALVRSHPDWVLRDATGPVSAGRNWNQEVFGLDLTHPGVRDYLTTVFQTLCDIGFDFFKLDFLYAGALDARRFADDSAVGAYRSGLDLIRAAVGPAPYLLGCGAPILPSIGTVDAMRVSPDTAPHFEPHEAGDLCAPAGRSSIVTGEGRAWQHGRWWVNDPDCLLTGRNVEHREVLAEHVERYGGLLGVSDRMADLDDWGRQTLARLCRARPAPTPFSELPG